jgi:putative alpha-1,2-mannosidase
MKIMAKHRPGTCFRPGAPLFKKITLKLENGKTVAINAANNNYANRYVNSLNVNGKSYDLNWLSHKELLKGAVINFNMAPVPNKTRGIKDSDVPYSLSNEK